MQFVYAVSSEQNYDVLGVYVDGELKFGYANGFSKKMLQTITMMIVHT